MMPWDKIVEFLLKWGWDLWDVVWLCRSSDNDERREARRFVGCAVGLVVLLAVFVGLVFLLKMALR